VLGKEDALGGVRQELGEQALALDERRPAQIESVEIEQVECVVKQLVLTARGEVSVQQSEIRNAPRIRDDGFAIPDQVVRRQGCEASAIGCKRSVQSCPARV
jgi:hypothetical protein